MRHAVCLVHDLLTHRSSANRTAIFPSRHLSGVHQPNGAFWLARSTQSFTPIAMRGRFARALTIDPAETMHPWRSNKVWRNFQVKVV